MSFRPVTIEFIKLVAKALGELNEKAVFVGGSTVPFYLPENIKASARATEDIDIVVEILRRIEREEFEKLLRKKGFNNDMSERAPLCRWIYRDMIVDIMSPEESVLGFSNRWYKKGMQNAWQIQLEQGLEIKILSLPYFLATKFEAFKDRGKNDFILSKDMEDIITVLDGSDPALLEGKLDELDSEVAKFLKTEFQKLLKSEAFLSSIEGSVYDRLNTIKSRDKVVKRIKAICGQLKS